MTPRGFARLAWSALVATIGVIVWGAYVRASGSGAGCGRHWPECNGEIIPHPKTMATVIEVVHRGTSGLALILLAVELVFAWRLFGPGHRVRRAIAVAMLSMLGEAAIGAGLVRFDLVASDASVARALTMSAHLVNTFVLLASLALSAWWSRADAAPMGIAVDAPDTTDAKGRAPSRALVASAVAMFLVGATGAVTALGDTLFPASSLSQGMAADASSHAHWLVQLRVIHPVLAGIVGLFTLWTALALAARGADKVESRLGWALAALVVVQLGAGVLNLVLLVPIAMQLLHLFLADAVWIVLVLAVASTMRVSHVDNRLSRDLGRLRAT